METNKYNPVKATPVKSFFVEMLTRDIDLVDAILDLLDNCVDGILRQRKDSSGEKPYEGFNAKITFDENSFSISDNCGGIPWDMHEYAFRMGKDPKDREGDLPTVGVYGIGMKRAIFKIGKQCLISTRNQEDCYEVEITPKWIDNSEEWHLPVSESSRPDKEDGTVIVIDELNEGIAIRFGEGNKNFTRELTDKVRTHYAFIFNKGFEVEINGKQVEAKPTKLVFNEKIKPYIYQTENDGVKVFLSVGFTRPIPSQEEINDEQEEKRYSSMDAGWTIICNDRAVLYCDRSELTGWGEAGVPRYHTQFIAIAGIVEFQCNDAAKLPTTTTKRGIDASSPLYLQVKNKMREGMKLFTAYTNHWKNDADESKRQIALGNPYSLDEIKKEVETETLKMNPVKSGLKGEQFKRQLPRPKPKEPTKKQIAYRKDSDDIQTVQMYLFGDQEVSPSKVGEECFDQMLREAQQ
ncbi:MAG: ATP-binding protein [Candidatus Poribacteria bacterium]|nr:ATP-binding protein [Candidatus Poribacteria bacterium]